MCSLIKGLFKFVMMVMNMAIFFCGIGLIILGSVMLAKPEWDWFSTIAGTDSNANIASVTCITMIVIGVVLFLIGFFGCYGTMKENTCMLYLYLIIVGALFVFELVVLILVAIYGIGGVTDAAVEGMEKSIEDDYGPEDSDVTIAWDNIQTQFLCCGANNYTDYYNSTYAQGKNASNYVPSSCCADVTYANGTVNQTAYSICLDEAKLSEHNTTASLYTTGCVTKLNNWIQDNAETIIIVLSILSAMQLVGMIVAYVIVNKKRDDYD